MLEMSNGEMERIASEIIRIAYEIMEYSGADANVFSDKKDPDSYDVVGDDGRGRPNDVGKRSGF